MDIEVACKSPIAPEEIPTYEQILSCMRCGLCLSVCPTYRETGIETQSPRGRVALMRAVADGRLEESPNFIEHMYHCLECRACQTVCPSGVKVGELVVARRSEIEGKRSQPFLKSFVLNSLVPYPERLEMAAWPIRLYQALGLQWLARHSGVLRIMGGLGKAEEGLPELAGRPLRKTIQEVIPAEREKRYRVGFFLGCVMSLVFSEASRSTVRVLARNGCEVVTPREQKCCGAPHIVEGYASKAMELARHNIDLFEKANVEFIITDCAACGAETKAYAHLLAGDPAYAQKAREFSQKVRDISEFLIDALPLRADLAEVKVKATYHDACHLCHGQGIREQPRQVLRSIPGLRLIEMKESDWCCGSAGTYSLTHLERSKAILSRKMANVMATEAEVVLSGNPGCLLQLARGVRQSGMKAEVLHTVQLLDRAYQSHAS
ncbi:MAG: (Fe-S)-binding protein [Chloroflexi bacterium]|nr:(Fe-S)-binding protein [Chloroflexota bacterium]